MISLSMPLTATDFAVRLSPLKISYFFLPAASDGLIFVSEVHFALKLLSYGNIFLLCFPLFFSSLPSENRMRLTADRSKTAHATLFKAALVAGLQPNLVICGCTFSFSGDGISEGILGICIQWGDNWGRTRRMHGRGQGGCMGEERGKEGNTGAGGMMQEAGRTILQNRKGSLQFHRSRGEKHPGRPSHAYPRSLPCGRCLPSHKHFPILPPVR